MALSFLIIGLLGSGGTTIDRGGGIRSLSVDRAGGGVHPEQAGMTLFSDDQHQKWNKARPILLTSGMTFGIRAGFRRKRGPMPATSEGTATFSVNWHPETVRKVSENRTVAFGR